jgi:eukaryotic-like serine/threonine-protein kinase
MRPYVELALERAGNPPRVQAMWLHHVAAVQFRQHQYDEAAASETKALDILHTLDMTPDNAAIMDSLALLASIESERKKLAGDWTHTRAAYAHALDVAKTEPGEATITAANIGIAESDIALGKPADAARRLDKRLAWLETVHADPLAMAHIRLVLARALVASGGDRARAKSLAETARDSFGKAKQNEAADAARWVASTFGR